MDVVFCIVSIALGVGLLWSMRELKNTRTQGREYKELFEVGDAEYKKSQEQIQQLLIAINEKNIVMERASLSLDIAGKKMCDQETLIAALDEKLRLNEANYGKLLGQKKSSEVRTGKITEQIAPFLEYQY